MDYMKVSQAATLWGFDTRSVRRLCEEGRIPGAIRVGKLHMIPVNAPVPARSKSYREALFAVIEEKRHKLTALIERLPAFPDWEQLDPDFMPMYIYNSGALEGNPLTPKETDAVMQGAIINRKPIEYDVEIMGHTDAFRCVMEMGRIEGPMSEYAIKSIHSLLLLSSRPQRGQYRTEAVMTELPKGVPAMPEEIEKKMAALVADDEARQAMPMLERIARFHLEFMAILPFGEANGRTARLLINLQLMKEGLPPIALRREDQKRYDDAFAGYFREKSADRMTDLLSEYVNARLDFCIALLTANCSRRRG